MKKHSDLYSLLFLSVLTAIFFFPVIFLGKTMYLRDLTFIFHPWKALCAEAIQKGEMPLWNPYAYCGMPLLANWQTAVFYPLSILFSIFSFTTALKAFHFVQILLAGYFAYLFVRGEHGNISAAVVVMVMFAFNGFVITKLEFLSYTGVISWTFALLLFRNNPLLLAVAICVSFLSGHQIFVFQIAALVIYMLFDCRGGPGGFKPLKNIAIAGSASIGLVAVQLLPTLELIQNSYRNKAGIEYAIAMLHSLSFKSLPGLISPLFYKADLDLVGGEYLQWDTTMYIGILGVFASLMGIFTGTFSAKKTACIVLILLGAVLALGNSTPVYPWLYGHLFIFHTMRYPVQYIYFAIIGLMILAGEGINNLCDLFSNQSPTLGISFNLYQGSHNQRLFDFFNNLKFGYILAVLIALELLTASVKYQPLTDNSYFANKPAVADAFQKLGLDGRFILSPGTESDRHISAKSIASAWQGARDRLYNLTCLPYHIQNAYGFGEPLTGYAIENKVNELYKLPNAQSALSNYAELGVRYVLCKKPLADSPGFALVTDQPLFIYQLISNPSIVEITKTNTVTRVLKDISKPYKHVINTESLEPDSVTFKQCYFPGWALYLNGSRTIFSITDSTFPRWDVPKGVSKAYYIYRPLSFFAGAIISLLTLLILMGASFKRLLSHTPVSLLYSHGGGKGEFEVTLPSAPPARKADLQL